MKALTVVTLILAACGPATALASEKLAQEKQCTGCHAVKGDGAAPSFQRIAAQWKGKANAESQMVITIREGSAGTGGPHWSKAKMPDQSERPRVSDAEAHQLARWILSL